LDPRGIEFDHGRRGKFSKIGKDVPQSGLAAPGDKALSNALLLLCLKECSCGGSAILRVKRRRGINLLKPKFCAHPKSINYCYGLRQREKSVLSAIPYRGLKRRVT
jgi:hypothetical protein